MKRISALILSVVLLMCMIVPTAFAAEFSQENISVKVTGYDVEIAVKTNVGGRMTAHLYNEAKNTTLGVDYNSEPVVNNGVYTYNFIFEMDGSVPTSTLYICVGNNVPATEKGFSYASVNDKNKFFNELSALGDATSVENYLKANKKYTSADIVAFENINSNAIRTMVSEKIDALLLATGYENSETETDEYKANKVAAVTEKEQLFNETFAEVMNYALVADSDESEWTQTAEEAMTSGLFDRKYFAADGISVAAVYPFFGAETAKMSELSQSELSNAFDRATLMAIESEAAYGTIKSAFLYFENKGSITVSDMTNINSLIAGDNDSDLWRNIKAGTYTDGDDLIAKIVAEAANLAGGTVTGGSGNNDITGTTSPGGFAGGGMAGGAGGGGSSKPEAKPEEPETEVPAGTFTDIANVDWAKESIEALAAKGVINGKGDGKFAPDDSVTREEFVKIIIGAFDLLNDDAKADFGDVDASRWSYAFIATANELGIVTGDGASFNPTGAMSRQDMAVVIYRTAEKLGLELLGNVEDFADSAEFADYAKDAIKALTASGVVNGMGDGTFSPKTTVTRAQAAKVIYGLMKLVGGGK